MLWNKLKRGVGVLLVLLTIFSVSDIVLAQKGERSLQDELATYKSDDTGQSPEKIENDLESQGGIDEMLETAESEAAALSSASINEVESYESTKFPVNPLLNYSGSQGTQKSEYLEENKNPIGAFVVQIINFLTLTSASLSFLIVIIGGFMIMTATGNETQMNKGKEVVMYAIIGLVISLSAFFIVAFVQSLFF